MAGMAGWMLDEVASAGRENLDPVHVARYDGKEDAGAAREIALLGQWGLGPGAVVVDIGAGTGQFALAVAPRCERVVAVDVSPVMLETLRLFDVVYDFEPAEAVDRIEAWCATGSAEAQVEGDWTRAELEEHVRDEQSTFTWLLEPLIRRCGFTIERAEHSEDGISAAYVLRAEAP